MPSMKYRRRLMIAPFLLFMLYVISTDRISVDKTSFWIYLDSDITTTSLYRTSNSYPKNGSCILRDSTSLKHGLVDLRVIVITYDRYKSLLRLLDSLERAHYGPDRVVVDIWLDRSKLQLIHNDTLQTAIQYKFKKGSCNVYVHPKHVGITGQWLSTWSPTPNSSEIAVILEDDLTVSPHFYRYLKLVHKKYGHRRDINGFSLQGKSMRHSDGECCLKVPFENNVFLYPTLGTSGFSPNNENWLKFHTWFNEILQNKLDVIPLVKNNMAVKWYESLKSEGRADSMWEMEYLYYTQMKKEFTLYPNFAGNRGLSFNWFEDGLHSTGERIENVEEEYKSLVIDWSLSLDQLPNTLLYIDNSGKVIE